MTVKREKLTVDVYYASETAEDKNVAKITVVTYNTETGAEVQASTIVRKVMPPAAVRDSIPVHSRCN